MREGKRQLEIEGRLDAAPARGRISALTASLLAGAAALLVACGFLWARFGAQVFLDAAMQAWRSCF